MKHTKTGTRCRPLSLLPSGAAIPALFLLLLSAFSSFAQFPPSDNIRYTMPLSFEKDVKGYATELWKVQRNTNQPFDEVAAGTVYMDSANPDSTLVHFISYDSTAQFYFLTNKTYRNLNTRPGDYADITHMRAVDVEAVDDAGNNRFFIVCQSREKPFGPIGIPITPSPWPGTSWKDHITVMRVDEAGNIIGVVRDIFDRTPVGGIDGYNLYATHSLYKEFGSPLKKILYICGYTTHQWSTYPFNPTFAHDKKSFVIALDADPDNTSTYLTPIASRTFDYEAGVVPNPNESKKWYDYDIAMRMQWLNVSGYPNHLFVTGSVNGFQNNGGGSPQFDYYRSGVMNFILDPLSLAIVQEHPYMSQGPIEPAGDNEYGVALWEDDPTTGSYFMVGNKFKHEGRYVNGGWRIDPWGFDPRPDGIWVNQVSNFVLGPSGSNWRSVKNKKLWVTQMLPTRYNGVGLGGGQNPAVTSNFLIAGMQAEALGTGFTDVPSDNNVNAFIADVSLDYTSANTNIQDVQFSLFGKMGFGWPTFTCNTGTGIVGTDANNFYTLGGGLANIMWYHNFTVRYCTNTGTSRATPDDIMLVAPKMMDHPYRSNHPNYGTTDRYLGIKHIHVEAEAYDYGFWDLEWGNSCGLEPKSNVTLDAENVTTISPCIDGTLDLDFRDITVAVDTLEILYNVPCAYEGNEPSYKTGTTSVAAKRNVVSATKIYPNPANEEVRIDIAKEIADETAVKVVLTNIHGQVISELYNGTAKGTAGKSMRLPQVATGLYIIHVYSNNTMIHQQKLSIQQ
ncbi:MAG: T9SS type A sorting domain-containing protein [Chitinophagales bacterium]|nr:T9SS type A sorting domain-containing protein [Chitinophagales bacterium]